MTQPQITETYRSTPLPEALASGVVPYLIPVAGRGIGATPAWWDVGDIALSDDARGWLAAAAEQRGWAAGTTVSVSGPVASQAAGSDPSAFASCASFPFGYVLRFDEPGYDPRDVWLTHSSRTGVVIHQTAAEHLQQTADRWAAFLASETPKDRAARELRYAEIHRRSVKAAGDEAEEAFREKVREALAAGNSVVDVAHWASLSRERVYQIRDSRR